MQILNVGHPEAGRLARMFKKLRKLLFTEIGFKDEPVRWLFVDSSVWNIADIGTLPPNWKVIRKRRSQWGREVKGFFIVESQL